MLEEDKQTHMHKPFTITIPTPLGATEALFAPAMDRKRCLIVVEDSELGGLRAYARAIRCLSAASRLTGVAVLYLPCRARDESARAMFDVLGALRVVRAWGCTRNAVILPERYREALFGDLANDHLLNEVLATLIANATVTTETLKGIQRLVQDVPHILQSVTGLMVARYIAPSTADVSPAVLCDLRAVADGSTGTPGERQHLALRWTAGALGSEGKDGSSALLDTFARWYSASLIGEELSWKRLCAVIRVSSGITDVTHGEVDDYHLARLDAGAETTAAFRLGLYWLDQQFAQMLNHLGDRDADRASRVRSAVATITTSGHGHAYRAVRTCWLDLDTDARAEWLRACSHLSNAAVPV